MFTETTILTLDLSWGGKHTILLAHDTPSSRIQRHESQINSTTISPLIDCAFTAHPSSIVVPTDIDGITIPISVAIGEKDMAMTAPAIQQMKQILEKKKDDNEVLIIPGAKHGFSVRMHPEDKHEMECAQKAETQAVDVSIISSIQFLYNANLVVQWFTRWLV